MLPISNGIVNQKINFNGFPFVKSFISALLSLIKMAYL